MVGIIHEISFDTNVMAQYLHNYFVGVDIVVVNKTIIKIRFKNGAHVEISLKMEGDTVHYRAEVKRKFTHLNFDCVYEQHGVDKFDDLLKDIKWFLS